MKISCILLCIVLLSQTCKTQEYEEINAPSYDESAPIEADSIQPVSITQNEYFEQQEESNNAASSHEQAIGTPTEVYEGSQNKEDNSYPPPYLANGNSEKHTYDHFEPEYSINQQNQKEVEEPKSHRIGGDHSYDYQSNQRFRNYDYNSNQEYNNGDQNTYQGQYYDSKNSYHSGEQQNYENSDQNSNIYSSASTDNYSGGDSYQEKGEDNTLRQEDEEKLKKPLLTSAPLLEDAKVSELGPENQVPKPVGFVAEMETVSLIFKYEKVIATFKEFISNGAENLNTNYGVPFPFNYIIMICGTVVSIYTSNKIREYMCRPKKAKPHVFNTVDHIDLRKIMKMLEDINTNSNTKDSSSEVKSSPSEIEFKNIQQQKEISLLRAQVTELREEIKEMKEQESKSFKMIESIATSQNDLETNVYKSLIKIYNKIERVSKNSSSVKERDASPISFRYRTDLA